MRYFILLVTLLFSVTARSQQHLSASRIRSYAADDATPTIPYNPATLSNAERLSILLNAGKTFMLVPAMSLSVTLPAKNSAFALGLNYEGISAHTETEGTIAYGRKLTDNISVGLGFSFLQSRIPAYISAAEAGVTAGVLFHLTSNLITGIDIRKQLQISSSEKFGMGTYHAGMGYTISEVFLISMEVEKNEYQPALFRTGLDYHFRKDMYAMVGFATGTMSWFFGSGARFSSFTVEGLFSYHPYLGWSPSVTIIFQKTKQK